MKRKRAYAILPFLLTSAWLFCSCGGVKRLQKGPQIVITPVDMNLMEKNGTVDVHYTLHFPRGYAHRKARVVLSPRFHHLDHVQELSPVVLYGKNSWRAARRAAWLEGVSPEIPGQMTYVIDRKTSSLNIKDRVSFEPWMAQAPLIAYTTAEACGRAALIDRQVMANGVGYVPDAPGPVITREITESVIYKKEIEARVFFAIDSYDLDMALRNNKQSMDSIAALVRTVSDDDQVAIRQIIVTGYASPDGIYAQNEILARERAEMVRNMLITQLHIPGGLIKTKYVAEDWESLAKLVKASNVGNKTALLTIITGTESGNRKNILLKRLPQFRYLADNLLPQLRHVRCEIYYTVREDKTVEIPSTISGLSH